MSEQPLFEASRTPPASDAARAAPASELRLTVRQVNELVSGAVRRHLPPTLHVVGEVSDVSRPRSGHLYFTLQDAASELRCVMWRSQAAGLRFRLDVGLEVVASGSLEVYVPRGTYQLVVRRVEPRGTGALELALRQLREKLEREGLFDPRRKRPLPPFPQRIAVITSPDGAAIRDILHTLERRYPLVEVLLLPVRVQGEGAAGEIATAIRRMNQHAAALGGIDVAIVGRGGGPPEDLWAFNEEIVARAIFDSRIPIVSAVGHEIDVSISDLVADVRAATPTAAAELVAPDRAQLVQRVAREALRARRAVVQRIQIEHHRFQRLLAHESLARPLARLRHLAQRIDEIEARLRLLLPHRLRAARERLARVDMALLRFGAGGELARRRQRLERHLHRLQGAADALLRHGERRLAACSGRLERCSPRRTLERLDERLHHARRELAVAWQRLHRARRDLLTQREQLLAACSLRRTLERGFSITRDAASGQVLRNATQVRPAQRVLTELASGRFFSTVEETAGTAPGG